MVATLMELHPGQTAALRSPARTTIVAAGQGGGKTTAGYFWLLANMKAFPGESHLIGFPDYGLLQRVIINQPDPDRQTIVQFMSAMGEAPRLKIVERRIDCTSGQIFFASGEDLIGWEGSHVKSAWLDEAFLMPLEAYKRAMERTRMRRGYVLLTGTPREIRWAREELEPKWRSGDPGVKHVQFPSTMNPRYPAAAMEEARRLLPVWEFRRLYLGELAEAEGGGVFRREWWKRYAQLPMRYRTVQAWDTAFKNKTQHDYSVCATWVEAKSGYYLVDLWRARVEFPELERVCQELHGKWQPSRVLVEDAASGQSLIQVLKRETRLPVLPVKVDSDKYARASAVSGLVESGRCFLPEAAQWVHDFVEEHAEFPAGQHDDQVDTTSMALSWLRDRGVGHIGLHM